jgi:hypothetical protein
VEPRQRFSEVLSDLAGRPSAATSIGNVLDAFGDRAFVDFRMRRSRDVEPYTSPPSGLWHVTDCRPD